MTSSSTPAGEAGDPRRSIGRRDVTEWRSRGGRRFLAAQRRLADRRRGSTPVVATLVVGAGVAVAGVWAATFLYDAVTDRDGISRLDRPALERAMRLRGPVIDRSAASIAHLFGPVGMPLMTLAVGGLLSAKARDALPMATVVAAGAGSLLMTIGGKDVVKRHRPPLKDAIPPFEHSPSFPSGHTLNATVVTGVIAYLLMLEQRRNGPQLAIAGGAAALAGGVGLSRVLLGAHWLTDVLTGWAAGAGWLATVITAHRLHLTLRAPEGQPAG